MRNYGNGPGRRASGAGTNAKQNEIHAGTALAALDDVDEQVELNRRRHDRYKVGLVGGRTRLVPFDERERNGDKNIVVELLDDWPISGEVTLAFMHKDNLLCRADDPSHYTRSRDNTDGLGRSEPDRGTGRAPPDAAVRYFLS